MLMHRLLKEKREKRKRKKNFILFYFVLISVLKNIYENLKIVIKNSRALRKCFVISFK